MATNLGTVGTALLSALDRVAVGRLFDDELHDYIDMQFKAWDALTSQLLGEPMDLHDWWGIGCDILGEDTWQFRLLESLADGIEYAIDMDNMREYRWGDSDWNPHSRRSIESYTDRYPHRRHTMPLQDHLTHAQRKFEARKQRVGGFVTYRDCNDLCDEEIPF